MYLRGDVGNLLWAFCKTCKAEGPVGMSWDEAIALWNSRTAPLAKKHGGIPEEMNNACRDLPEGYIVCLKMENGAAWVELETPDGIQNVPDCDDLGEWIKEATLQAEVDFEED